MELIINDKQWFLSEQGQKSFENCKNLAERSVFIYSYFKSFAAESLEKDSFLFKMAFLMADSIYSSSAPYAKLPEFLDSAKNPFVAYVKNAKKVFGSQENYCILLSILHKTANPFKTNDWIYNHSLIDGKEYIAKLKETEKCFIEESEASLIDGDAYNIDESLRGIQIEIAWLFILAERRVN